MTDLDVKNKLDRLIMHKNFQISIIEREYRQKKREVLKQWAKEHARFQVGDILSDGRRFMKVTNFEGNETKYIQFKCYVTYYGIELTKQLKPRKDGSTMSIYDDGSKVIKIK